MLRFVYTICILIFASSTYAGPDTSSFVHFNLKNGLPSNNVYSFIQDKSGYTWLATDNGLVKYNGYTFEVYNTDNGGLPANDVFELYEDRRGRIWIKTFSREFGYVQKGKYKSITYNAGERIMSPRYLSEAGGLLSFCSWYNDNGYVIIVVDDDVIKTFPLDFSISGKHGLDTIYNVFLQDDLSIFLLSSGLHLFKVNPNITGGLQDLGQYPEEYRYSYMHRMGFTPEGKSYLFYPGGYKLHYFDLNTFDYKEMSLNEWGADAAERIVVISPNYIKNNFIKNNTLLTNTHIYEFTDEMEFISRTPIIDAIPCSQQLVYILKDKQRNNWYATNGDGVWVKPADYDFYSTRVKNVALDKSKYIGNSGKSSFWLNSVRQKLCEVRSGKIVREILFNKGIDIKSATGNDSIAYICATDGVYLYHLNSGNIYNLYERHKIYETIFGYEKNVRGSKMALNIYRSLQLTGNDLYALSTAGLAKITFSDSGILVAKSDVERYVGSFYDEETQKLYAYSGQRILIADVVNESNKAIDHESLAKLGIGNIRYMEKGPFGSFIILDESTLFFFDEESQTAKEVEVPFSLSNAHVRIVGKEIFIIGRFGIAYAQITNEHTIGDFKIVPNSGTIHYSKVEDFVVEDEKRFMVRNDLEWCLLSIDSLKKHAVSIKEQNGFFTLTAINPFERTIHSSDTLMINQIEPVLKLDAINYNGKGVVRYLYRFEGSADWQTSTSGEIFLAGMAPYEFHKIKCKIKDDLWESNEYAFYVYRYPKWWQTGTWKAIFWISGVVSFFGIVILIMLVTRYYVAKKNERKRALTELELQAIHSQINPHFIFNTLSAALFYINKKRFDDAYTHVSKFSQLLRSYLKSSQDRYVILEEEIKMLRNYIELQQIRFEEKFDYRIEIDNKLPLNNIKIPSLLLQPLVENAINHGLFHMEKGGILLLKFKQGADNTELVCTIEDNGVGREAAKKINENSSSRESYGTKLTHQLLDVFRQYEHLDIKLTYTDKEVPETGTVVTLTLKNIKYVA